MRSPRQPGPPPAMDEDPAGILEPRQERSQESTRRLLEAAAEIIAEDGYDAATIAAIGERAGYSRGLVSTRFGSKDNLMWALTKLYTQSWFDEMLNPPKAATGLEQLVQLVRHINEHAAANEQRLRVVERIIFEASKSSSSPLQDKLLASQRAMELNIAEILRAGARDGSIRADVKAKLEAALLVATLRGISYQWFLYPGEVNIRRLGNELARQLEFRLSPAGPG